MSRKTMIACAAAVIVAATGCETMNGNSDAVKRQNAKLYEVARTSEEQMTRVNSAIEDLQQDRSKLIQAVNANTLKVAELQKQNDELRAQINTERKERAQAIDQLISKVSGMMSKTISSATSAPAPKSSGGEGPAGSGEYVVYTVQSGDTLGVIAKAYGVTVDSVRKVNSMKNDNIRVGQKLYVPKK